MQENPVETTDQPRNSVPGAERQPSGCLQTGLLIFIPAWILLATIISQSIMWVISQSIFEGASNTLDLRWLVELVYALAVSVPALIIWLAVPGLPARRLFAGFALAGGFALCMFPARLAGVTAAVDTALLQIGGAVLFLIVVRLLHSKETPQRPSGQFLGLGLLIAGALSFPWVVWGALGSVADILLNLAVTLLFGAAVGQIAEVVIRHEEGLPVRGQDLLLEGFVLALALLVMVTGLGVNGNQGLLSNCVPVLGWAIAALFTRSRAANGRWRSNAGLLGLLAGLAAFWPLAFIDPDELAAVISLGPGELIQWANLASFVGLTIGLAASILLMVAHTALARRFSGGRSVWITAAALLVWLGAIGLYFGLGQPGLYGERLFVILKDQGDLRTVSQIPDAARRRAEVYRVLVQQAETSQAGLRQALNSFRIPYQPYYLENGLEVQGGPLVRWWLRSRPEVDRVLDNPMLRPLPGPLPQSHGSSSAPAGTPWNIKMIGADRVWNELGVTGKGVVVGQSDSGVQGDHVELADSYRGQNGQNDYNWYDPWYQSLSPTDIGGHGTHTLGTVLGNHVGVAPDAQWIGCVNLARNLGNPAFYLDCMQFMLAPFPANGDPLHDGRPELGAQVLNNSWGCPPVEGCDPNALLTAVSALRAAGVFVVASAGNEGQGGCATVSDPIALYAQVYSVGAVNQGGTLAPFSSKGPVEVDGSGRVKPDISAPGVDVPSAFPGNTYEALSGTSMAGPHVAGVVALMWSANPALVGDIERTQQILDETTTAYTGPLPNCGGSGKPNNAVGFGIVNAYEAVRKAAGK